jgi:hypothetical protein
MPERRFDPALTEKLEAKMTLLTWIVIAALCVVAGFVAEVITAYILRAFSRLFGRKSGRE